MPITQLSAEEAVDQQKTAKRTIMWFGIVSIVMLFAGLTSAYIVRQGEGKWVQFSLPHLFVVSTLVIVFSSLPMQLAVREIKNGNQAGLRMFLLFTTVMGLAFVILQYLAWDELVARGIYFVSTLKDIKVPYTYIPGGTETAAQASDMGNVAASFLYVITGLHVAHVLGGILALGFVLSKSFFGKYTASNYNGVRMCAIYWHFLAGLWVYLFLFLNYIR